MNNSVNKYRLIAYKIALRLLRGLRSFFEATWPSIAKGAASAGRLATRIFILPIYRLLMLAKLRSRRLMLPARGLFLLFITNRYLFHVSWLGALVLRTTTSPVFFQRLPLLYSHAIAVLPDWPQISLDHSEWSRLRVHPAYSDHPLTLRQALLR